MTPFVIPASIRIPLSPPEATLSESYSRSPREWNTLTKGSFEVRKMACFHKSGLGKFETHSPACVAR